MKHPPRLDQVLRQADDPGLAQASVVEPGLIMALLSDGFLLINAIRASQRVLYETLLRRQGPLHAPIFPIKLESKKGLEDRVPILRKLGFDLRISSGFAVINRLPKTVWAITDESLQRALDQVSQMPPMALEDIALVLTRHLCLGPETPLSNRSAAQLVDALFGCQNPWHGPFGGVVAQRFTWKQLSKGIL